MRFGALAEDCTKGLIQPDPSMKRCWKDISLHKDLPDPDLLIRTSGEARISNFLLWQLAYTEMYFTPTLWPDFRSAGCVAGASGIPTTRTAVRPSHDSLSFSVRAGCDQRRSWRLNVAPPTRGIRRRDLCRADFYSSVLLLVRYLPPCIFRLCSL